MKIKYGRKWDENEWSDLSIELWAFRQGLDEKNKGLGKLQHFKNVCEMLWPFDRKTNPKGFEFNPWAERMAELACEHKYLGISGPKSSGKTEFFAVWALVNWLAAPRDTLVLVTSTSLKEARKRIWGSIRERYLQLAKSPVGNASVGKLVDSQGIIRLDDEESGSSDKSSISLIPSSPEKEQQATAKLIGLKQSRVFLIGDEMTDISSSVVEACFNLNSNAVFQFIALGNFKSLYDPFGQFITPKNGWKSINVDTELYETKMGVCLHLDGTKSPNLDNDDCWPYIYTSKMLKEAIKNETPNSISFWRFTRSFPAPQGSEELIYSESDLLQFNAERRVELINPVQVAGIDPGFTNGGDRFVVYISEYGKTKDGEKVFQFKEFVELIEDVTLPKSRSFQMAEQVKELLDAKGVSPKYTGVDSTGAGSPFCDVLSELWSPMILRVGFQESASQSPVSMTSDVKAYDKYIRRVTEVWYSGVEFLRAFQLCGVIPALAKELTARRYMFGTGNKIQVEPKPDMKARTGRSPDIADAALLSLDVVRQRLGAVPGGLIGGKKRTPLTDIQKKLDIFDRNGKHSLNSTTPTLRNKSKWMT